MEESVSDFRKVQSKKEEIAKKVSGKTEILSRVAKKYKPKIREAECELARDVWYEAIGEYEKGEYAWEEFISELTKSLKALKLK